MNGRGIAGRERVSVDDGLAEIGKVSHQAEDGYFDPSSYKKFISLGLKCGAIGRYMFKFCEDILQGTPLEVNVGLG